MIIWDQDDKDIHKYHKHHGLNCSFTLPCLVPFLDFQMADLHDMLAKSPLLSILNLHQFLLCMEGWIETKNDIKLLILLIREHF